MWRWSKKRKKRNLKRNKKRLKKRRRKKNKKNKHKNHQKLSNLKKMINEKKKWLRKSKVIPSKLLSNHNSLKALLRVISLLYITKDWVKREMTNFSRKRRKKRSRKKKRLRVRMKLKNKKRNKRRNDKKWIVMLILKMRIK